MTKAVLGLRKEDSFDVIALQPNDILGRHPLKPTKQHVDLGMDKQNATNVARNIATVESVSKEEIRLKVSEDFLKNPKRYPIYAGNRQQGTYQKVEKTTVVLKEGDEICFTNKKKDHKFTVTMPNKRITRSRTGTEPSNKKQKLQDSTNRQSKTGSQQKENAKAQHSRKSSSSLDCEREKTDSMGLPPRSFFLKDGESPVRPHWLSKDRVFPTNSDVEHPPPTEKELEALDQKEEAKWRAPSLEECRKLKSTHNYDSEDSDEEFHGSHTNSSSKRKMNHPVTMHTTLANTYWKALNSNTPHIGSQLLFTLLDAKKLPPSRLCRDLVLLVTFGCYTGNGILPQHEKAHHKKAPKKLPTAYFDGARMDLALEYIEAVCLRFPAHAYDLFGEAAGPDYWKNALDQLYTLTYLDKEKSFASTALSLQLHTYTVHLLYRLVNGLIHRSCVKSPIIRDMEEYGGRSACKVAAQVLAHIWVTFGHHYFNGTSLGHHVQEITETLGKIVFLMLEKFVPSQRDKVDILHNALDAKIEMSDRSSDEQWLQDVKIFWIESLGDHPKLEEALVSRLRIKEAFNNV